MSDFKPPKPNKVLITMSEFLLPFYLNFVEHLSFKFSQNPDRPIEFLKGKRAAIVINHSDRQDPLLVVALAKYMHENFYCIAARECFDWSYGILGWLFQRFGCFSVDRGTTDFRSIHTIQKILTDSQNKFIVFPEGEVTGDDHLVHELPSSLMHIFLKAQSEIVDDDSQQSIWILPVGVSYKLETDLYKSVAKTLIKVERHLDIKHNRRIDTATRAKNAVTCLLRKLAENYQFGLTENLPLHEQIQALAEHICQKTSACCENEHFQGMATEQLLHCVRSELLKRLNCKGDSAIEQDEKDYGRLLGDLDRTERLLIVQRVLNQTSSPIQICRIIDFLESEIFGRMTAKGKQRASVYFGSPIEVLPYLPVYQSDKNEAAGLLRNAVRDGLQLALDNSHLVSGKNFNRVKIGSNLGNHLQAKKG